MVVGRWELNLNKKLVEKLRLMRADGANAVQLLDAIKCTLADYELSKPLCMKYFKESFRLSFSDVAPIGGWCGMGGELSNEQVCELLEPCLKRYMTS